VFQGNEGTFERVDDTEELVSEYPSPAPIIVHESGNTIWGIIDVTQHIFKVINGSVKEPELTSGYNGLYGYFTGDDTIISFSEGGAQSFLADIEGRNTVKQAIPPNRENFPEDDNTAWQARQKDFGENIDSFPFGFTQFRPSPPPTLDSGEGASFVVDGDDSISITGEGGIVESYAVALDNKENPNNLPETAQEATQRKRSSN